MVDTVYPSRRSGDLIPPAARMYMDLGQKAENERPQ